MRVIVVLLLICALSTGSLTVQGYEDDPRSKLPADLDYQPPTVLITVLVRNKGHVLPYFLSYLEKLDYPKERISLWLRCDHSTDNSIEVLQQWLEHSSDLYHSVNYDLDNVTSSYRNESSPNDWPVSRFKHVIELKEQAMAYAQSIWADFIFFLDVDVLLTAPQALKSLTSLRLPIVAPMLLSEGLYSNFWCGMTSDYYYQRTDEYKEIYYVKKEGVFEVPMVHTAVLVDMNYKGARYLTFDRKKLMEMQKYHSEWSQAEQKHVRPYNGPVDDIIVFAISANSSGIPLFVSNQIPFGYVLQPLETSDTIDQDIQQIVNIKANMVHDLGAVPPVLDYLQPYLYKPEKTKLTLDHIYMINLERRPERRQKMENLFAELALDVEHFSAVDGKALNADIVKDMGITILPGYEDPYHHRAMTMGEIGCFLSHYKIWQKIVELEQKEVLILEDDIRFEPYLRSNAVRVLEQARSVVEYDLIYFGRKRLKENEARVDRADNLVHAGYSYWTLGYVISLQGARKLLAAKPLEKLIPVDEFLPVMFDRHPNQTWSSAFKDRNLIAFSAAPLLLYPTHYTGETGYISDTEDSVEVTAAAESVVGGARLKSDREQIFANDENILEKELQLRESSSNSLPNVAGSIAKNHQEL
ncbi:glycosyltransferase 25 family member [Scaptodrosophila lebanonensis]|uniref:Glycosyltransferase 25 family member n=1 Tax=Drosophila lebanonensis TaxID=7225 RepID=A0A6J2TAE0_DROLE|nr:glycosyltransferase 25 family member [Scaptodrosophila lebanonensis]